MALCQSATKGHAMLTAQSTTFCPEGRYRFDHTEPSRTDEPPARYMPGPRPRCGFWYPTVEQSLVSWLAYEQGKIPFQVLRGYWYLHELKMQRCEIPPGTRVHYPLSNLAQGIETGPRQALQVRDALREVGLALWTDDDLQLPTQLNTLPWLDRHRYESMRAHVDRKLCKFPLHRSIGKYVVRKDRPGLLATTLGVALRCLRYNGKTKTLRYAGAVSADWIAGLWDISERTAYRHIETLEALRFLTTERRQPQWHKEEFGPWRVVARDWAPPKPSPPMLATAISVESAGDESTAEASAALAPDPTDPLEDGCTNLSPQACTDLAVVQDSNHNKDMDLCTTTTPQPLRGKDKHHSEPAPDVAPPAVPPTSAALASSPPGSGVCCEEGEKPQASTRPLGTDALEAAYAAMLPEQQAALRAEAEASLGQQGYKRAFLTAQLILHDICCLLAAQEGYAAPVAPAASADVAPPPAPVRPTPTPALGPPTLDNVIPADVQVREDVRRALELGRQAQNRGWIRWREPDRLYVVAAALHAGRCGKDNPCGLYRWLLEHPDEGSPMVAPDEPEAHALLKAYDYGIDPQQRKPSPSPASTLPALSKYAWIVREQQRLCTRAGLPVDVCALVRQACPALSGEAQDSIVRELAQYQRSSQQAMALHRLGELGTGEDGLAALSPVAVECAECGEEGPACTCREDGEDG